MELGSAFTIHAYHGLFKASYCIVVLLLGYSPSVLACSVHLGDTGLQKIGVGLSGCKFCTIHMPEHKREYHKISLTCMDFSCTAVYRIGDFLPIYNSILFFVPLLIAG